MVYLADVSRNMVYLADVSMNMVYFSRCLKEYGLF